MLSLGFLREFVQEAHDNLARCFIGEEGTPVVFVFRRWADCIHGGSVVCRFFIL